jgi:hypothetical protein
MTADQIMLTAIADALLGAWALANGRDLVRAVQSRHWPSVTGQVTTARRLLIRGYYGSDPAADIRYRYHVGSATYDGNAIGRNEDILAAGDELLEQYQAGCAVRVYYDPRHPERAVLQPGANVQLWVGFLGPLVVAVAVAMYAIVFAR